MTSKAQRWRTRISPPLPIARRLIVTTIAASALGSLRTPAQAQPPQPRGEIVTTTIGALLQSNAELIARAKRAVFSADLLDEADRRQLGQQAAEALIKADYQALANIYAPLARMPDADPWVHLWHSHALQLQGEYAQAVAAYRGALSAIAQQLASLNEELAAADARLQPDADVDEVQRLHQLRRRQQELASLWPQVVLFVGLLELNELDNPAAAAESLSRGLRYSPLQGFTLRELAQEASRRLVEEEVVLAESARRELMYPIATQRYLAIAHQRLGNREAAIDAWTRVRLSAIAYDVPLARTEGAHLRLLFAELGQESLQPWHRLVLRNLERDRPIIQRDLDLQSGPLVDLLAQEKNPFEVVPIKSLDFVDLGPAAPSMVRLPDGRLLAAYTTGDWEQVRIHFSTSQDGKAWSEPWPFPHNSVFNTRSPSLLVDDAGTIWLVCLSKRLDPDRFSSAGYFLWMCHSRDSKTWSRLRPILTDSSAQYQSTTQFTRSPDGRYWLFYNRYAASAPSPDAIMALQELALPIAEGQFPSNTHATFAPDGTCHLVFDDFGRAIYYTHSSDLQSWSPLEQLAVRAEGSSTSFPQLFLAENKAGVALLYDTNQGLWLRRGRLQANPSQLDLRPPVQCTTSPLGLRGANSLTTDERIHLLAGSEHYTALLTAELTDLFGNEEPPPQSGSE